MKEFKFGAKIFSDIPQLLSSHVTCLDQPFGNENI